MLDKAMVHGKSGGERQASLLKRVDALERELERLKRDILHGLISTRRQAVAPKPLLFGSVRSGNVTEEMIEEAKGSLFCHLRDLRDA